ncbi:S1C family serine protease [Bifidobacterium simiarum]|uniref:Peptidase n=1 Tax=Bifidobacterium simiarum TaxID=2045441 RepID=A0A2M9HGH6_9BIFI|nr:trypsin-like peptidase domain-containing protein [Bifidobacterium simiarum]PJM75899.1 peptidase [Bifidobacterium simiarum]
MAENSSNPNAWDPRNGGQWQPGRSESQGETESTANAGNAGNTNVNNTNVNPDTERTAVQRPLSEQPTEAIRPVAQQDAQPTQALPTAPAANAAANAATQPGQPQASAPAQSAPSSAQQPGPSLPLNPFLNQTPRPTGNTGSQVPNAPQTGAAGNPGQPSQPTNPDSPYRPAPLYGAYGPIPEETKREQAAQNQAQPNQPGQSDGQNGRRQPIRDFFGISFGDDTNNNAGNNGNNGRQQGNAQGNAQGNTPYNPFQTPQNRNGNGGNPQYGQSPAGPGAPGNPNTPNNPGGFGGPNGPANPGDPNGGATKSRITSVVTAVIAAVVAVALSLGIGFAALTAGWVQVPTSSSLSSLSSNSSGSGTAQVESGKAPDWQTVAKNVSGAVVAIQTQVTSNGQTGIAKGSGAIISKDGDIVTNNHVVSGASQIMVTLSNGNLYEAKVVGTDVTTDLAVIKLQNPPSDLTVAEFADSDELAVGENVMAIGNPLGYENTATTGIVSALNRPVTVMDDDNNEIVTNAVQLDAAINPGNSGGPTFNAAGQIIGINSSIATSSSSSSSSSSSGSIGIGFAIPSNLVKRVTNEIIKNGKVQHVALGVTVKTSTATADGVTRAGSAVQSVVSGGPADKAGVKAGDVIVGYNGKAVGSNASLLGFVRATAMGETAKLTIVRSGKTIELSVTMNKEESAVNGSNRSESTSPFSQNNNGNGNSQNGNGDSGSGNSDNGSGSDNGYGDLFGW